MIVNWNRPKAGLLNIPCITEGVKGNEHPVEEYVTLIPGWNEVPTETWDIAKQSCKPFLHRKEVVELKERRAVKKTAKENKINTTYRGEIDFEDNFPYNDILAVMKGYKMADKISAIKFKETEVRNFNKAWLMSYFQSNETAEKQWGIIQEYFAEDSSDKTVKEWVGIEIDELDSQRATEIIVDTYNLKTLNLWIEKVSQPDLRVVIMNQIKVVNAPPKKSQKVGR